MRDKLKVTLFGPPQSINEVKNILREAADNHWHEETTVDTFFCKVM